MAEEEGPEQSPGPGTQPGPGQEHYDKFTIGEEEARQFPQPEWKSELPDIRMQVDQGKDDEGALEQYLESLRGGPVSERYDSGRSLEATLSRHTNPETLLSTIRLMRESQEELSLGAEMPNDYTVGRIADVLDDRKIAYGRSWEELVADELIQTLDDDPDIKQLLRKRKENGLVPKGHDLDRYGRAMHAGGYGLGEIGVRREVEESYMKGADGKKANVRYRTIPETLTYFGTPERRKELSEMCDSVRAELLIRHLLVKNWSRYKFNRENLTGLVEFYFGPVLETEGIERLFNLPGRKGAVTETAAGVKLRNEKRERRVGESEEEYTKYLEAYKEGVFGNKVDMAMRLYYINALSEKQTRFKRLMETPGWEQFIFPEEMENNRDDVIKEWIGNPENWVEEEKPVSEDKDDRSKRNPKRRTKKTLREENGYIAREDGKKEDIRGKLTRGNIFASNDTLTRRKQELDESIREFIGGGEDKDKIGREEAIAAQRIAYRLFKLWMIADVEGFEIYYDDPRDWKKGKDPYDRRLDPLAGKILVFDNGPAASDFGKLTHPWLYMTKSWRKGRDFTSESGIANSKIGYERFCTDFLRHARAYVPLYGPDGSFLNKEELRSFHELWWGYPEEVLNGVKYEKEEAQKLGEMPWSKLKDIEEGKITTEDAELLEFDLPVTGVNNEALQTLYLSTFMAGRKDIGIYQLTTNTEISDRDLTSYGFWRKFWKALDVGVGAGVAVGGEFRGLSKGEIDEKVKARKIRVVEAFIKGFQSLPQWQEWDGATREYYDLAEGKNKVMTVAQRIIEVAKWALKQYDVELKAFNTKDLYR